MPGVVESKGKKVSKNAFRRAKKKAQKQDDTPSEAPESEGASETPVPETETEDTSKPTSIAGSIKLDSFDVELDPNDPSYDQFKSIFDKFQDAEKEDAEKDTDKPEVYYEDDDIQSEEEEAQTQHKISKKARKAMNKLSIAELKALVKKPELVEWTDTSSSDPRLLVSIKSHRNVVPVPNHWSLKREYLSSKRGIEKAPFALPKFIQETGIAEMRDAVLEKQAEQTLKQRQRERVQGKLGKLDIDYQKLYEAFFRRQTKPELTRYGEVYYEGKEYETNLRHLRPGELSEELQEALSMPPGYPPPWLLTQQRTGPPPSYPALKIPGLNAPIPPGASWGWSAGQWGKPPVDDNNRPLYGGDLFGTSIPEQSQQLGEPVERNTWGELRLEGESEDEESEEEDEEEEDEDESGLETPSGLETSATGFSSIIPSEIGGTESIGGEFTLRKQRRGTETEESVAPRSAYQVLPEQSVRAQGFFGGERVYDLKGAKQDMIGEDNSRKRKAGDIDVSVDVDALAREDKLNKEELKKHYDAQRKAEAQGQWGGIDQEDLSEMIATESRKRLKKDEERRSRR